METTGKYGQSSHHLTQPSCISKMSRMGFMLVMTTLLSGLLGLSGAQAQSYTFSTLHSFDYTDGGSPHDGLVQGTNGNLYGTTASGGAYAGHGNADGTVFEITSSGALTTLHSFSGSDGDASWAGLVKSANGNLYGTTTLGGTGTGCGTVGCGTIFEITPSGTLTTLHDFNGTDGAYPRASLVLGSNGSFYGTTYSGGAGQNGYGTIFEITTSGTLTTLHNFGGIDGAYPYSGLVQAANGKLYGTTYAGGTYGEGAIFEITTSGKLTVLHSFDDSDGAYPYAGLVKGTNGDFYGTTNSGGFYEGGNNGKGTIFEISPSGKLTTLHVFGGTDGAYLYAPLIQGKDGNFYGTTYQGGEYNEGTVFEINSDSVLVTLISFDGAMGDGTWPYAPLVQDTNGNFYGTTFAGGEYNYGTVFALAVGK